jgi:ribosomal protein L11 methyltransferase
LDVDYLTQWQQFFPPLCIGERLMIRPPWDTLPVPATMTCLTLNPGPAFGTGTHPSTHLCLLMLLQYAAQCQGSRLLDVGCGSGILSLAALQLGWQSAVGVDIDTQAIAVATHNAELNGLQDRVRFLHGSWQRVTGVFLCITANVYLGPLVEMLQPLTRYLAPGGTIILSGLLASQEAAMRTAIQNAGLAVQARRGEEEWMALAVRRARDVEQESLHV